MPAAKECPPQPLRTYFMSRIVQKISTRLIIGPPYNISNLSGDYWHGLVVREC
jgi:hypothetical protein